jgi:hypothetical protein
MANGRGPLLTRGVPEILIDSGYFQFMSINIQYHIFMIVVIFTTSTFASEGQRCRLPFVIQYFFKTPKRLVMAQRN